MYVYVSICTYVTFYLPSPQNGGDRWDTAAEPGHVYDEPSCREHSSRSVADRQRRMCRREAWEAGGGACVYMYVCVCVHACVWITDLSLTCRS